MATAKTRASRSPATLLLLAVSLAAGLAARASLLDLAPRWGFTGDHVDYVCWGRQTRAAGVLDLYRNSPGTCPAEVMINWQWQRRQSGSNQRLNYPPLAAYIFAAQGWLLERVDADAIANTHTSRVVYATSTTLAELVIAWGVWTLVGAYATPIAAAWAFGLTWLAPLLLLDGPFWGQTESWVLAPVVWMIVTMIRGRWLTAGAIYGLALALKPSALLFGPLWLYALLFRGERIRHLLGGLVAVVVLNLIALPFWLDSGASWLRLTYLDNYVYGLQWSTAMAFNVWYADLLATGILDPRVPLLGLTRDTWGLLLLVAAIAGTYALVRRWERRVPERAVFAFVPLAALVALAGVMLPTRVHSTYGAFVAPFLIATAFLMPRATLGTIACTVTLSLQILSWQWATLLAMHAAGDEHQFSPALRARRQLMRDHDRPREWALTIANLAAAAVFTAGVAATRKSSQGLAAGRMSGDTATPPTVRTHPLVLAALAAVALFLALRTHTQYGGWNDTSRLGMVEAIVERGHLWLDGTAMGRKSGDVCMIDGHYYSDKPPVVALMAVPVYAAEVALGITFARTEPRAYYWTTLLTIGLSTLLGLVFLERFLRHVVPDPAWRALTVAGLGLGSLNTAYSVTFSNHPPSGTLLLIGVLLVWWWRRYDGGLVRLALGGWLIGVAATADHGAAFYLPFVGLYALWPLSARSVRATVVFAVAAAIPLVAYAAYAYWLTGSPMPLPLQPRLFQYPGSYWSKASGHLPGSSFAHDSLASLAGYVWLCLFGTRGLFSHTPILLFVVAAMLRLAGTSDYPRRAELVLILLPTAVLMAYYFVTSDNPGGNSYGVRWYCLFIPLLFVFLADGYRTLRSPVTRTAFWIAYALSFPLALIGSLAPWLDPTPYGTGFSWVLVLRAKGWI